ncbi:uncharacterized protein [Coffea arabica]|uniref:Uncharacterized protein n=1 Tax=Coffea arabica TaxID=13443 RepID=A0A6P6XHS8_COFAR|nr:uncharacterized serine-rich protein C215.13-like [Coffea arabica]
MASACVNKIGMSPEKKFLDCPPVKYPSYGWLSPRISFSREFPDDDPSAGGAKPLPADKAGANKDNAQVSDPEPPSNDFADFEFRLEDPVNMLPADELFSDGKLVPLQLSSIRPSEAATPAVRSPDTPQLRRRGEISATDPCLFSPKAPRCSSRWKELLGLKKLYHSSTANSNANNSRQQEHHKATPSTSNANTHRSLKHFLHRSSKSSLSSSLDSSSSLSLPLLRETDSESVSLSSSRLSLSSSSSGHEHDDLPRLSLDSEKPTSFRSSAQTQNANGNANPPRVRVVKSRALSAENAVAMRVGRSPLRRPPESTIRGVSVDSPRMNSSGKIVFHSLERSSSSPSSFNGGHRYKHRGMERSYSANVRVTPVLNVPVCSLRGSSKSGGVFGFPLFSSSQPKKEGGGGGGSTNGGNGTGNRGQLSNASIKSRPDRT